MDDNEPESPAAQSLGKTVIEIDRERGYIKASFVAGENFVNRGGRIFGGYLCAMLDSLCGHATRLTHREPNTPQVTLELKTSFIGRADVGTYIGEGWVRHRGKSIAFAEAELRSESGELVARASATLKVGL